MKRNILKTLLLLLGASSALSAVAYDVQVGVGYYRLNKDTQTAILTSKVDYNQNNITAYVGDVVIPETFEYEEVTYTVNAVDSRAFYYCSNLASVELPSTITKIGASAFFNCTGLKSVKLPECLQTIGYSAFQNCSSLEEVELPSYVSIIGQAAFSGCTSLCKVTFPTFCSTINSNAFYGCTSLEELDFPATLQTIGSYAFFGCTGLQTLQFPKAMQRVEMSAFQNCKQLKRVEFNDAIQLIDVSCFADCERLSDVYMTNLKPPSEMYATAFFNTPRLRLHLPNEGIETYHKRDAWKQFVEILPLQCSLPVVTCSDGQLVFTTDTNLNYTSASENFTYSIDVADFCENAVIDATEETFCDLSLTYDVRVRATVEGCDDSEEVVVQLCWIDADNAFIADASEIITGIDAPAVEQRPVVVTSCDGALTVMGLAVDERVKLYDLSGRLLGEQTAWGGDVSFSASVGQIVIIRVGNSSFKIRIN